MKVKAWQVGAVFDPETGVGAPMEPPASAPTNDHLGPDTAGKDETTDFVLDAFSAMERDYDDVDEEIVDPGTVAGARVDEGAAQPPPQEPPKAEVPNAQSTPAQAVPPAQPGTPTTGAQQGAQAPSQAAESSDQILSNIEKMIRENEGAFRDQLAQNVYAMSDQDLAEFHENPGKVIAAMAARVHMASTQSMLRVLSQQLPVYVNGIVQAQAKNAEGENRFWSANPGLNRAEHAGLVRSLGQWYRSQNPNSSEDDFIKVVGRMASAQLGLAHNAIQQAAPPGLSPAQVVQTPGRVVREVMPPPPALGMHAAPPSAQPQQRLSEWDQMARLMETYEGD